MLPHSRQDDLETGPGYKAFENDHERESLLPTTVKDDDDTELPTGKNADKSNRFNIVPLSLAFFAGGLACVLAQLAIFGPNCFSSRTDSSSSSGLDEKVGIYAPPYVGSSQIENYPPTSPTNAFPSLFPSDVGYPGGTPTGAEPGVIATAPSYPIHSGAPHLVVPSTVGKQQSKDFDMFKSWGNLSPWYSVPRGAFGLDSSPEAPEQCKITGLHLLHRHGARYPTSWTSYGGPANLAKKLHEAADKWNASGELGFLNDWTYKLGEEVLTPFGRQQLYDLGVSMRIKYGFLLNDFTATNTLPVFRTESQDRMLYSALNFAIGFFGYPHEHQYLQSITIEASGFNNTLAPYETCPHARDRPRSERGLWYIERWAAIYLKDARARIQRQLHGFDLSIEDIYIMQQMCAYETVAIGYSKFCELFTEEEWKGFDYALDLTFWYNSAFGSPVARIQGIGWIQELVARLTHTPFKPEDYSTTLNSTLNDNPVTFPLNQSLYVDATHEVVVLNIITALNLTRFAEDGPLPWDHIPHDRKFRVSELAPFATNMQLQLLECSQYPDTPQIRIIINDGVAPLTGIKGCPEQKDGMCPVDTFVKAQREIIRETDWSWGCRGDWEVPEGPEWTTVTGDPPRKAVV